jgi:hypothetical protein
MHVLTVLKSGPEYKPDYLYALADSVLHFNPQAKISCLTDMQLNHPAVEVIFKADLDKKWWGKLSLFSLFKKEPVLYMDIDTVCVGDLNPLLRTEPGFTMLPNVYKPGRVGSGVMSWHGDYSYLSREFSRNSKQIMAWYTTSDMWGDQAFIEHKLRHKPDLFGNECLSYKAQVAGKLSGLPDTTSLVYFHGKPRPWQTNEPWQSNQ